MFYIKELEHTINLHPSYFNPTLKSLVTQRLYAEVEGKVDGDNGYIVCVIGVTSGSENCKILNGTGHAEFKVYYQALVYRPWKGEVVDGVVENVGKIGFFAHVGPFKVFCSQHFLPADYKFEPEANPPAFVSNMHGQLIRRGSTVRVRLLGLKADQSEITGVATLKGDFLGLKAE